MCIGGCQCVTVLYGLGLVCDPVLEFGDGLCPQGFGL